MEIRQKLSTPPEEEEIKQMVIYARNVIEEFRNAKHYKNILHWPFHFWILGWVCVNVYSSVLMHNILNMGQWDIFSLCLTKPYCVTKYTLVFFFFFFYNSQLLNTKRQTEADQQYLIFVAPSSHFVKDNIHYYSKVCVCFWVRYPYFFYLAKMH